jgi:hypothetical protein
MTDLNATAAASGAAGDHELVVKLVPGAPTTVYLCHLSLRQAEWSRRHSPGSADEERFMAIAEAVLHDCEAPGA